MSSELTAPANRTHLGQAMTDAVSPNSLNLQRCGHCDTVQYPPREVCVNCLSDDLPWSEVTATGTVLASSELQHCLEPFFAAQQPWLMGSVKLDCGPVVLAHLASDCATGGSRVWVVGIHDSADQATLVALSETIEQDQTTNYAQQLIKQKTMENT